MLVLAVERKTKLQFRNVVYPPPTLATWSRTACASDPLAKRFTEPARASGRVAQEPPMIGAQRRNKRPDAFAAPARAYDAASASLAARPTARVVSQFDFFACVSFTLRPFTALSKAVCR
jgi:hypothetical protein